MAQFPNLGSSKFPSDPEALIFEGKLPFEQQASEISEIEKLMSQFDAHEDREGEFVERYREVKEKSQNPLIKFLFQLIISDEEKHRATIHAIASTLKADITWTHPESALRGFSELNKDTDNKDLLKLTMDFTQHEKEGIKEYKKLSKSSKSYYRGLFNLLLKSIIRDSEKHVEILDFIRRRLKEA